jgi:molybdopterin-guanine dinucleotide biosynthesis protein
MGIPITFPNFNDPDNIFLPVDYIIIIPDEPFINKYTFNSCKLYSKPLKYCMVSQKPFIISVTGAHSNVGKTSVCSILLSGLKEFGAIKFTKTPLYASLIEDMNTLNEKGKDTAFYLQAGAQRVVWVKSPYHELKNVLDIAMSRMKGLKGVVVEGNSPVDFLNTHLIIFIKDLDEESKPTAEKVSKKADIVIINSKKKADNTLLNSAQWRKDTKLFWIDLTKRKEEHNEFLCFVKKRIDQGTN